MANFALVVGINEYPILAHLNPLRGAVADACDFAEWALDPAGGAVTPDRLFFWTHPWPDVVNGLLAQALAVSVPNWDNPVTDWAAPDRTRAPTAGEIINTLERTGRDLHTAAMAGGGESNRAYVFFAGHGLRTMEVNNNVLQTCFVTGDFRPVASNNADGLVPCTSLRRSLRNNRFHEVLVFLDCCRNDFPITSMRALPRCDLTNDRDQPQWSVGHATEDSGFAHETTQVPYRGAFSKTLIDGLRTCRDAATGTLTVDRLDRYIRENIVHATSSGQRPYFAFEPPSAPIVVVVGLPTIVPQPGAMVDLSSLQLGARVVLRDGTGNTLQGVPILIAGPDLIPLPPLRDGLYSLELEADQDRAVLFKQPRDKHVVFV